VGLNPTLSAQNNKEEKSKFTLSIRNADALSISIYNAFTPKIHNSFFKRITDAYTLPFALNAKRRRNAHGNTLY
jgi:hypothetical protein